MPGDETKSLWSMATKTCLVLTVKNNKVESVSCKECDRVDAAGESSRLQLFMLMNSFLSLVVWHSYFIEATGLYHITGTYTGLPTRKRGQRIMSLFLQGMLLHGRLAPSMLPGFFTHITIMPLPLLLVYFIQFGSIDP